MNIRNLKCVDTLEYGRHYKIGGSIYNNKDKYELINDLSNYFNPLVESYKKKYKQESNLILIRTKVYNRYTNQFYESFGLFDYRECINFLVSNNKHVFKLEETHFDLINVLSVDSHCNRLSIVYFVKDSVYKDLLKKYSTNFIDIPQDELFCLCNKLNALKD